MRKIYLVTGSHDGPIGIYSSQSKANDKAIAYIGTPNIDWDESDNRHIQSNQSDMDYADIEVFILNR